MPMQRNGEGQNAIVVQKINNSNTSAVATNEKSENEIIIKPKFLDL